MDVLSAPRTGSAAADEVRKPRRSRYWLVGLLVLAGLMLAAGFGLGAGQARTDRAQEFARVAVPGVLTLHVDKPATYYAYSEGTVCLDYPNCHGKLYPVTVSVTGPGGGAVAVDKTNGPTYMIGGNEGTGVARFDAKQAGDYRVSVSTGSYSEGNVAVGKAFPWWTEDWLTWLAMFVVFAIAALVAVVPIATYRRRLLEAGQQA